MNAKLFVRNLSWSVTENDLYELFGQSGEVISAKIPIRREDGKPRGFAFVEMASLQEGQQAIQSLNGYFLQGRDMVVDFQDENRGSGGGGSASGSATGAPAKSAKLFVRSLSYGVSEADLEHCFQQAGHVVSVKIPTDRDTGEAKGFGFVEMASVEEAEQAIQRLNHTNLGGKDIVIDYQDASRNKSKPAGGSRSGGGGYGRNSGGGGYGGKRDRSDYSSRW
ncbi:RNA recognition motif domain-containing protein [Vampirovibrio sp.]|uniref:RNA recognition motif domain-containing protein n=1 Tax=Vampirovibrio sp. TaxID=2717857 RepID=UPI003593C453